VVNVQFYFDSFIINCLGRVYIIGGIGNSFNPLNTVEVYSTTTGGQVLPYTMANADSAFSVVVIS
jgi:hypothetical protein